MLARLQKCLDGQEAKVAREHEKTALERDDPTRIHNQFLTQIKVLKRAYMRGSDVEKILTYPS